MYIHTASLLSSFYIDHNYILKHFTKSSPTKHCEVVHNGQNAVCWNYSDCMLNQKSIECTESNSYCIGTVNCTVDHAQYADSVKKSISELSHTAVCRLQNKVKCFFIISLSHNQ